MCVTVSIIVSKEWGWRGSTPPWRLGGNRKTWPPPTLAVDISSRCGGGGAAGAGGGAGVRGGGAVLGLTYSEADVEGWAELQA